MAFSRIQTILNPFGRWRLIFGVGKLALPTIQTAKNKTVTLSQFDKASFYRAIAGNRGRRVPNAASRLKGWREPSTGGQFNYFDCYMIAGTKLEFQQSMLSH